MQGTDEATERRYVVPRKGDVDRNSGSGSAAGRTVGVVPRKGDVDRNGMPCTRPALRLVVPRKGDVDRNGQCLLKGCVGGGRPPQGGRG